MALLLVLAFLAVPVAELAVIISVAGRIGVLETVGLLILVSVVGAWLVKREGASILRRLQGQLQRGVMPTRELVDGALVMFAGALLLTPGFLTDLLAILLLVPLTRAPVRALLLRRFRGRVQVFGSTVPPGGTQAQASSRLPRVIDVVDLTRLDPSQPAPGPPGAAAPSLNVEESGERR